MSVGLKEALFFAAGVAVGLYVAKLYARNQVNSTISDIGAALHLPSSVTSDIQGLVTPAVVG